MNLLAKKSGSLAALGMTRLVGTTILVVAIASCGHKEVSTIPAPAAPPREAATFPASWHFKAGQPASFAEHAMAVSNNAIASRVAADIMKKGGNAVDAAVALGFALTVTYPAAGNIGGGGFMVIHRADGTNTVLDYRETAPAHASRNMYLDSTGKLTDRSVVGHLSVGVPGSVAGLTEALRKYGTMTLAQVIAPAIELAEKGFVVDSEFNRELVWDKDYIARYEGRVRFYPNGEPLKVGARLVQPELAWTLQQIAERGAAGFYQGPVADSLVAEEQRGGGIITLEDLRNYTPIWRDPVTSTYRGYTLVSMPPSSSGGITMTEALNVLETYPAPAPFGSTLWAHHLAEAYQRAFLDRNSKIGDPAFVHVPQDTLTDKTYAQHLRGTISETHHTPTSQLTMAAAGASDGMHTTHYSVADANGNAVAVTTTLNNSYGSGVWVRGAGFFLNDEMDDFAAKPGFPNMFGLVQGEQNAIVPGKRMLSAMTPTVVLDPTGRVLLVVGGAGGPTIITGVSQVILNVLDYRMSIADAMRAPRVHHQSIPDTLVYEQGGITDAVLDSLRAMGHNVRSVHGLVNINAIMRVPGGWQGVPEPRSVGGAIGY